MPVVRVPKAVEVLEAVPASAAGPANVAAADAVELAAPARPAPTVNVPEARETDEDVDGENSPAVVRFPEAEDTLAAEATHITLVNRSAAALATMVP